jgi:hypothetical protein
MIHDHQDLPDYHGSKKVISQGHLINILLGNTYMVFTLAQTFSYYLSKVFTFLGHISNGSSISH